MVKKGTSRATVSQVASAATLAKPSSTQTNKTSLLHSAFSPSRFQLSLFASVIQGFDSQLLRIHNTNTGRLKCNYKADYRDYITCLDWGYSIPEKHDCLSNSSKKKRKRGEEPTGVGSERNPVVAFGTSGSEIQMFSPSEAKVVRVLKGGHSQGVRDFKFKHPESSVEAWSLGGDGKLVQWNLRDGVNIRTISLPTTSIMTLLPLETSILCASNVVYLIDPTTTEQPACFSASNDTVHTLISSSLNHANAPSAFLAAAENNLYVNVFNMKTGSLAGSLVAENDVELVAASAKDSEVSAAEVGVELDTVAAVTKDGIIELFPHAFTFATAKSQTETFSLRGIQKNKTHKATAFVKFVRPDKTTVPVPITAISFEGNDLVIAWVEAGMDPNFERIQWRNAQTRSLAFTGIKEITRAKSGSGLVAANTNGIPSLDQTRVDESRTVIANNEESEGTVPMLDAPEIIDISSAEEDSDSNTSESPPQRLTNGDSNMDRSMLGAGSEIDGEIEETEEPSFGDLLRASAPEAIDVIGAFDEPDKRAITTVSSQNMQLSSGLSLGTVLSQALRTNDLNMLESCLHFNDLNVIRATIERLPAVYATTLLTKLAERLHNRPGRAGSLMVWIQWTLVAHGGYLAGKPEIVKKLASLHRVVKERANSLQALLSLKGKLDMLDAQMNLRKKMQKHYGMDEGGEEDEEDAVIYVEGQEDPSSQEDLGDEGRSAKVTLKNNGKIGKAAITNGGLSEDEKNMDALPSDLDGAATDSEDELNDSDSNPLLDQEASETDTDSGNEFVDDVDYDDLDSLDDEDEEAEAEAEMEEPLRKQHQRSKLSNGIVASQK